MSMTLHISNSVHIYLSLLWATYVHTVSDIRNTCLLDLPVHSRYEGRIAPRLVVPPSDGYKYRFYTLTVRVEVSWDSNRFDDVGHS